jgi:hypothetical protein
MPTIFWDVLRSIHSLAVAIVAVMNGGGSWGLEPSYSRAESIIMFEFVGFFWL